MYSTGHSIRSASGAVHDSVGRREPLKQARAYLLCICALVGNLVSPAQQSQPATIDRQENKTTPGAVPPKITPAKEADIRRFMELTGGEEIRVQLMKGIQSSLRPTLEQSLPPGAYRAQVIDLFLEKFGPRLANDVILPMIVSVYDSHFSDDELKQLVAFYESPLGKKAASVLPDIDAQIPTVQASSEKLAQKCMAQVLAEHPDLKQAMEKAEKVH